MVSEITFSNKTMNEFKQKLIDYLLSEKFFDKKELKIDDFDEKFKNIISEINENAPIKIIHKNKSDNDIILMFNEILKEIEKFKVDEIPKNLIEDEVKILSQGLKENEIKNKKKEFEETAKKRIKVGLILNEFGEQNKVKV
ncbi:MAG: hypothetical protein QF657_06730, partial [Candidatus Nitrosopelagicus sp.]|nr:hypothetical protein [Candidatus Nitrosopelagicus sp.]